MPRHTYIITTSVTYISTIIVVLLMKDIGVVYELIASLAICPIAFIYPSYFYLKTEKKFRSSVTSNRNRRRAYGLIIIGSFLFLFFTWAYISELISEKKIPSIPI